MRLATLDWLNNLGPNHAEPYWFTDERIYAGINAAQFQDNLDWGKFENYMGLQPVPKHRTVKNTPTSLEDILPIKIDVKSNLGTCKLPIDIRDLDYLIRRLEEFDHKKSPQEYLYQAPGLNIVTRGIIALREYAVSCGEKLDWSSALENYLSIDKLAELNYSSFARTLWPRYDVLPDAAAEYDNKKLLQELRQSFNALQQPALLQVLEKVWSTEEQSNITYSLIRKGTGCTKRDASRFLEELSFLITERFIPEMTALGLRYRCMLTPNLRPRIWNAGLARAYEMVDSEYPGFFLYIEPRESSGPKQSDLQEGAVHFTATRGVLSFRLDLWDGKKWLFEPYEPKPEPVEGKKERWLIKEVNTNDDVVRLKTGETVLLGILMSYLGDDTSRDLFLELLEFPSRSERRYRKNLIDNQVVERCYHPKLCFSGLHDGVLLAVTGTDRIEEIRNHLLSISVYCEIYSNESDGSLWSIIRMPRHRADICQGVLAEYFEVMDLNYYLGRILSENSYMMTQPRRLYDEKAGQFTDPWTG
ncbi:MAG: hypothetical protein GF309_04705 [Candidatus Lokiarchaeota archaeon]|nr:hypothetical protein [Candidatus Lokiarchaeota archaeon]